MSDIKSRVFDKTLTPFERLTALIAVLRSPQGCSWDRKQTHKSLLPYLIEEAYEVIEAVEADNYDALRGELGDLLCQVIYHGQLAKEAGLFDINDSVNHIIEKLVQRHPHVFGEQKNLTPKQVKDQWEKLKIESGENKSVLAGIPSTMPALTMAYRIGEKAGGVGFDWHDAAEVIDKLNEELQEISKALVSKDKLKLSEEIGDLLFAVASMARKLEIDPEQALRKSLRKFRQRFEKLQQEITQSGKKFEDFSIEQLEEIWQKIK